MIKVDFENGGSRLTFHTAGDSARLQVRDTFASAPGSGVQHLTPKLARELGAALLAWGEHQDALAKAKRARKAVRKLVLKT